jgi:hypothetical protein
MMNLQKSRAGFVVVKLHVNEEAYYLMRVNPKWKDLNFLGGHQKGRDGGDLEKTARRELWEEVPLLRNAGDLQFVQLTDLVQYGPIHSQSKGGNVEYELKFFLLKLDKLPEGVVQMFGRRTKNVLVAEADLLHGQRFRVSGLVKLLDSIVPDGLRGLPFSSTTDLGSLRKQFEHLQDFQLEFALK